MNFLWGGYERYYMKGFICFFVVSFSFLKESSLILRCWRFCAISVESCRPQPEQTVRKWVYEGMNNQKPRRFNKMGKYWHGKGRNSIKNGQCMIDDACCVGKHWDLTVREKHFSYKIPGVWGGVSFQKSCLKKALSGRKCLFISSPSLVHPCTYIHKAVVKTKTILSSCF